MESNRSALDRTYCEKHGVNLVQCGGVCALCERGVEDLSSSKTESLDSTEQYYAHMESDRNSAEASYFAARPLLDREGAPVETFRAGFERAYQLLWNDLQSSRRETDRACQETREALAREVAAVRGHHETEARHLLSCSMVKHRNCTYCDCGSSVDPNSSQRQHQSPQGSDPLDRAPTEAPAAPGEAWKAVREQLARDRLIYGTSYSRIDADGTVTRIDPSTIMIAPQPESSEKSNGDVYGANCRLHPGAMFKPSDGCPTCEVGGAPYVLDANGHIPSASTDDTPPAPTSSVECPKCRTQLAFEGDVCGLCSEEES